MHKRTKLPDSFQGEVFRDRVSQRLVGLSGQCMDILLTD